MLIRDPTKRLTAHEVLCKFSAYMPSLPLSVWDFICMFVLLGYGSSFSLNMVTLTMPGHPWIVDDAVAPDKPIDSAVLSRLKNFSAMNKLKKMALRVRSSFFLNKYFLSHSWYVIMLQTTLFSAMLSSVRHFCYNTALQVTTYYICALKLTSSVSFSFLLVLVFHVNWIFLCTLNVYWSPLFFRKPNLHTSA